MKKVVLISSLIFLIISLSNAQSTESFYNVLPGTGNGIRFWSNPLATPDGTSNSYKIHMGDNNFYHYGPVSSFSIKMNMSSNADRGWTWGVLANAPIAALNTQGHMQIKGNFTSESDIFASRMAIGTTTFGNDDDYLLNVWGKLRAHEIVCNTTGADFVFEEDYKLRDLYEVESFISKNHHLPEIAPAKEMQENGVGVSELGTKLLQKVEELTLYVISLKKEIDELKEENKTLKNNK